MTATAYNNLLILGVAVYMSWELTVEAAINASSRPSFKFAVRRTTNLIIPKIKTMGIPIDVLMMIQAA